MNDLINYRDWYLKIVFGGYRESCPLKKFPPEDCPYSKPNPNPNANAGGVYWGGGGNLPGDNFPGSNIPVTLFGEFCKPWQSCFLLKKLNRKCFDPVYHIQLL